MTGYESQYDADYKPVYVRVKLTQTLKTGGVVVTPTEGTNISDNQYPTQIQWTKTGIIKTIDTWVSDGSRQREYWILDSDGWAVLGSSFSAW